MFLTGIQELIRHLEIGQFLTNYVINLVKFRILRHYALSPKFGLA